jgi:hypothetical protein
MCSINFFFLLFAVGSAATTLNEPLTTLPIDQHSNENSATKTWVATTIPPNVRATVAHVGEKKMPLAVLDNDRMWRTKAIEQLQGVGQVRARKLLVQRRRLDIITSSTQCKQAGGINYAYCPETQVNYCCGAHGACSFKATCPSRAVLLDCACSVPPPTSSTQCKQAGGFNYAYCPETKVNYCCGNQACSLTATCPSRAVLLDCACLSCGSGQFQSSNTCKICPAGYYQIKTGQPTCTACQTGQYLIQDNSKANDHSLEAQCLPCQPGRSFVNIASECAVCSSGRYQTEQTYDGRNCRSNAYLAQTKLLSYHISRTTLVVPH